MHSVLPSTASLASSLLFQPIYGASRFESLERSYQRAIAIGKHYRLTTADILTLSERFWAAHMDPLMAVDIAASYILMIQWNLVVGTIAPFVEERPDLKPLMEQLLNMEVFGEFMLTELDHGLDAKNLETTATRQSDGSFVLHTPRPGAAKFMPPTMPIVNVPRVGLVMARLIVDDEDRGLRAFVVPLNDGKTMCKGVTSVLLPAMKGGDALDHAVTSFNKVTLPADAMLGSLARPVQMHQHFLALIHRVGVGSVSATLLLVPGLKLATYLVGRYSLQRAIGGPRNRRIPIIRFRTQQLPMLHALAHSAVLQPFATEVISRFCDSATGPSDRQTISAIHKAVFVQHSQKSFSSLIERCGAQGVFEHNHLTNLEVRWSVLWFLLRLTSQLHRPTPVPYRSWKAMCLFSAFVRRSKRATIFPTCFLTGRSGMATELLLGRCSVPPARHPGSLLARHEAGLLAENRDLLRTMPHGHRSEKYNQVILPRCRPLVEAIGHRMAYEAAADAGVDRDLLSLYEAGVVLLDASWYVEHGLLSRMEIVSMEEQAATALLPRLEGILDGLEREVYVTAPMGSASRWGEFLHQLPVYGESTSRVSKL
ncbi:acyl-CoA dehydrogenase NM domain-like protein [Aspergillus ibericus CBS 121593]|uniref:Acyl-CoA dehydrogenase NM domain-like protein n=1 Tax=Aspergillus ibericus CBS 121593 TaxID=1448316 RepID=A0A395H8E5_9EURO|nr:acyl-CoA dehydrogenase NM domain-like protein [Aspergillus ibericus CBS 121593]RAL03940.1 acyl-CoA dehydrogenase NM domain-like protein [Aspergillus ibericus CBS 121593]